MKKDIIFLVIVIFLGAQQLGEACECSPSAGPAADFLKADAVFVGAVTEVSETGEAKLDVNEIFKGELEGEVAYAPGDSCGFMFVVDKQYLVYATMTGGALSVDRCGSTKIYDDNNDDLSRIPRDKESCESLGGKWGRYGLAKMEECSFNAWDAGKPCTKHAECSSVCYTEEKVKEGASVTGKCFARTITRGYCLNYVEEGKATGVICKD